MESLVLIGRRIAFGCLMFFASAAHSEVVDNREINAQKKALREISEFSNDICNQIPISGGQQNITLDANGRGELSRLLKSVGSLGFSGGARYSRSDYNGLLPVDLGKALHDAQACRLEVFQGLKDKLLTNPASVNLRDRSTMLTRSAQRAAKKITHLPTQPAPASAPKMNNEQERSRVQQNLQQYSCAAGANCSVNQSGGISIGTMN